jgi:hypothetical protein
LDQIKEMNADKQEMKFPNGERAKFESKKFAEFMSEMKSLMQLILVADRRIRDCEDALHGFSKDSKKLGRFS